MKVRLKTRRKNNGIEGKKEACEKKEDVKENKRDRRGGKRKKIDLVNNDGRGNKLGHHQGAGNN